MARPVTNTPEVVRERLRSVPHTATGCWEWDAATNGVGYGLLHCNGTQQYTHRLSYQLFVDDIPEGLCVLHRCDNPPCCNPAHLFVGTKRDNAKDAYRKGRHAWAKKPLRGERHGRAILTESQVREVRALAEAGWVQQDIADAYGIEQTTVSSIKRRVIWKELA